ncbi:MAG TPA: cytochrome c biogenesis protein CcdA, partial [Thermoguttaceae bacterium]|nr:cytochrome c biogenesis protein CcdA [Thermoguttaceae bacterium]
DAFGDLVVESHYDRVTWHVPIELTAGIDPSTLKISGAVRAQPCDPSTCLPPQDFPFTATLGPGVKVTTVEPVSQQPPEVQVVTPPTSPVPAVEQVEHAAAPRQTQQVERHGDELPWHPYTKAWFEHAVGDRFDPAVVHTNLKQQLDSTSIWREVLFGFLGGILLNLMPCVLPVIGLKVLSFVEQAGRNRWQALLLNVWYSVCLISVFLVLASLAVFFNYGWGHLFRLAEFNIAMAVVVFAMGLSFLGVWEIPIPGFIGSGKSADLTQREGFAGAFSKGVITTILATPCTGPFMASALAWAVSQPPVNTYAVFASVGLGMASPYLLIGAFPALVRFLPKPGAWMDTFKQIMGFVLLGTVVYIFTFLKSPYVVPTIGLLFAFWGAFWWIARTPLTADAGAKVRAWLEAATFAGVMWILLFPGINEMVSGRFAFRGLHDVMQDRFEARYAVGETRQAYWGPAGSQTVLIDFTADWCATCKTLEATVLNTAPVRDVVMQNSVATMKADTTHDVPPLMKILGVDAVPTLAIFPADDPNSPIIFRGWYSVDELLAALKKAGPSKR